MISRTIANSRADALARGHNRYMRPEPCDKCGERLFCIRRNGQDACRRCERARKGTRSASARRLNYLARTLA